MTNKAFTNKAIEIGTDCRVDSIYRKSVLLRETKTMLIGNNGRRYKKANGHGYGNWPMFKLEMSSIREIEELK